MSELEFPEPELEIVLEVILKKSNVRFSIPLEGRAAESMTKQLKPFSKEGDALGLDTEEVRIWMLGGLKWQSEEQYQYHKAKRAESKSKDIQP